MASLVLRRLNEALARVLKERAARHGRTIEDEHRSVLEAALSEPASPERQRLAVARRLNRLLTLLNAGAPRPEMTVVRMAEHLGLDTASDLEDFFAGEREAPLSLLDRVAGAFGADPQWLKFGAGQPFRLRIHGLPNGRAVLDLAERLRPQRICFVRAEDRARRATVVFQVGAWRYEGSYDSWHVSDQVGATGQRQLAELRDVAEEIEATRELRRIASGYDVPAGDYTGVMQEEVFAGSILDPKRRTDWHRDQDFTAPRGG